MRKAYMVIWIDREGTIVDGQCASEYPLSQLVHSDGRQQVKLTEVQGNDFEHARDRLVVRVQQDFPWAMKLPTFEKQRERDKEFNAMRAGQVQISARRVRK